MPDNLSPEEKLLRLIKGERPDSSPPPAPRKEPEKPAPQTDAAPAQKPAVQSKNTPEPAVQPHVENASKPAPNTQTASNSPSDSIPKQDKKPAVQPPANPISAPPRKDAGSPVSEKPSKPVSAPQKPVSASSEPAKPSSPEQAPASATIPDSAPAYVPPRMLSISSAFRWLASGFTFLNIILLAVLIIVILLSFWFVPGQQVPAQTAAALVPGSATEEPTEEFVAPLPRPYPYYVTAFAQKSLFKVIKPPPPPKPTVEKKEPEKPKILIETLTRHLVLQGIVYDIGPPQAIVFDKKSNKTMFLGNGDMITDEVKIKEIHRGKVILEFEDQTQELSF